jgi:hypothetical protein
MSRINTVPRGLQSFLGNTNMGDNPSELSQVTAPVVNLSEWLRIDRMRAFSSAGTIVLAPPTDIVSLTVPDNKLWFLVNAGLWIERTTGTGNGTFASHIVLTGYPSYSGAGAPGSEVALFQFNRTFSTQGEMADAAQFATPIPLPAGVTITWRAGINSDSTNDTYNCKGTMLYFEVDT